MKFHCCVFPTFLECTKRCECQVCQPMPTAHESVCCVEIGQVWQKVEDQRPDIQMKCITEYPVFQSTCLDVWMYETANLLRIQTAARRRQWHRKWVCFLLFNYRGSIIILTSAITGFISVVHKLVIALYFLCRRFRYIIAYRQLVRWCWGFLGKHVLVALPSCAVNKIWSTLLANFVAAGDCTIGTRKSWTLLYHPHFLHE